MYGKTMKEEFIEEYMRSRIIAKTSLYSLFKKTEPFEEELGKDCSRFTEEEILDMYEQFRAKSYLVLLNYNSILKAYSTWIKYRHDDSIINAYNNISKDKIEPLVNVKDISIFSRQDIDDIEYNLLNWTDQAVVECLWEGIAGKHMCDLVSIKLDMIDEKEKKLTFPDGRVFDLTDRLCFTLVRACKETEYVCYCEGNDYKTLDLYGRDSLYKERDNAYSDDSEEKYYRWVYRKILLIKQHLGINSLTMKNITTSGMRHYLQQGMQKSGLELIPYLKTEEGEKLMEKYGFTSESRIYNIVARYAHLI